MGDPASSEFSASPVNKTRVTRRQAFNDIDNSSNSKRRGDERSVRST